MLEISLRGGQSCPVLGIAGSTGLITGHSWAHQPRWWCLCENIFRKGPNATQSVRNEGNLWDRHVCEHYGQRKRKVRRPDQRHPCSLWRTPEWRRSHGGPKWVDMPWSNCSPWSTHVGAQKKMNENRKERLWTDNTPPFPIPSVTLDEGGRRVRNEVVDLEESRDRESFEFCLCQCSAPF